MALQTQDFTTLNRNQVAAAQASSSQLLDFQVGSILLSVIESNTAGVALWLQGLILQLLSVTRLATSQGADVDSFIADYGLTRLPAVSATGQVTFARFTNTQQAVVLASATPALSTQVQTADGTQTFYVTIDTTNPNYNAALGGYVLVSGTSSISVPVQALVAGTGGNVLSAAISVITTGIPYVDTVTNASAFTNGLNQESDAAVRLRFVAYLASLARATKAAIGFAILSVQQGLSYTLTENQLYNGTTQYGYFYVVVDDGTGNPGSTLLSNVNNAIDTYRGFTINFGVFAPVIETANVTMTITTASGYTHGTLTALVQTAIQNYINTLTLGNTLYYTRLIQIAYDASPGVIDVTNVLLNSGTSDLVATNKQVVKSGTITIS